MPEYRIAGLGLRDVDLYGVFSFFFLSEVRRPLSTDALKKFPK